MSRWVRVQTSIFDHEIFSHEPFTEREAWLWMITAAAWKDTHHRIGSEVVDVPMGSFFSTIREMQLKWGWRSTTRVSSFLKLLEKQDMISVSSKTGKTQVTVCNYSKYQNVEDKENTPKRQAEDTEKTLKTPVTPNTQTSSLRSDVTAHPEKPSVKSELMKVLDEDHAQAVVDHRNRLRKPLTPHAAKLLAGKFGACSEPNVAADAMVSNGWQGFEPEWLDNRGAQRGHSPPGSPRQPMMADLTGAMLRQMNNRNQDDESDEHAGPTIESCESWRDHRTSSSTVLQLADKRRG